MTIPTDIQVKLDLITSALNSAATSVTGLAADIEFLKNQIDSGADITAISDALQTILDKAQTTAQQLSALDGQTDSSGV